MKRNWDEMCNGDTSGGDEEEEDWSTTSNPETDYGLKSPQNYVTPGRNQDYLRSELGHSRTIVHIDLDCFYAQVEMLRNPALRDKPLGIQQKSIVVTTNYVARARGISKLSYVKEALEKCPDLVLVNGEDLTNYRETSQQVTELLEEYGLQVERLGFDENFMDVTDMVKSRLSKQPNTATLMGHIYGADQENAVPAPCQCGCRVRLTVGSDIAKEMRESLLFKLGLTSCAGIATNKLLAKVVGGQHKPNDQTVLYSEWTGHFIEKLTKVRQIPGIGHSSDKKLTAMGITSLQELRDTPISKLQSQFGSQQAETMMRLAHGIDDTPVVSKGLPQSLSDEDSFKKCSTLDAAKTTMSGLIKNLIKRLNSDGRVPHTMRLTIRKFVPGSWQRESRQTTIPGSIFHKHSEDLINRLLNIAVGLLRKLVDTSRLFHLTLINVCLANLKPRITKGSLDVFVGKHTLLKAVQIPGKVAALDEHPLQSPQSSVQDNRFCHQGANASPLFKKGSLESLIGKRMSSKDQDCEVGVTSDEDAIKVSKSCTQTNDVLINSENTVQVQSSDKISECMFGNCSMHTFVTVKQKRRHHVVGTNQNEGNPEIMNASPDGVTISTTQKHNVGSVTSVVKNQAVSPFQADRCSHGQPKDQRPSVSAPHPTVTGRQTSQVKSWNVRNNSNTGNRHFKSEVSKSTPGIGSSFFTNRLPTSPSENGRGVFFQDCSKFSHLSNEGQRSIGQSLLLHNVTGPGSRCDNQSENYSCSNYQHNLEHGAPENQRENDCNPTCDHNQSSIFYEDDLGLHIPPDVDKSVFDMLPSNMKQELIADWKRQKAQQQVQSHVSVKSQVAKTSKSSAKKRQKPVGCYTITKYFKH